MFLTGGLGAATSAESFLLTGLSTTAAPTLLSVKKLTFQKTATTTGIQTISGVGFQGVALLLWSDRQTAAGVSDQAQMCLGMTDGARQVVRSIHHPDNEASTTSAQAERTDRIVWMTNATSGAAPTVQVEGSFVSFTSDGFRINWVTNDASTTLFHALVIGGVSVSLEAVKITVDSGNTIAVTGVGFQPDAFVVMGGAADEYGTGDYNVGAPAGSIHGFGFSNATDNMCSWTLGRGTAGASDAYRGQHTDRVTSVRETILSGGADLCSIQITATGADGFTVLRTAGTTTHQPVQHILAIKGARFEMGSFNTPASAGTHSLTLSGYPKAVLLQTHNASTTTADGMNLAFGAWDTSTEGGVWIGGSDNANPSVYARATYTDAILKAYTATATGASSTLNVAATVAGSGTGFVDLDFTTVPATPVQVLYLAMLVAQPGTTGGTVPSGTNPAAGAIPTDIPLHFITIALEDGSILGYAETPLADAADYYNDAGYKAPRILKVSPVRREMSDENGTFQAASWTVELADHDRVLRGLQNAGALVGAKVDLYLIDDATRRAEGTAFRVASGVVSDHRGLAGFKYELTVEDSFGNLLSHQTRDKKVPRVATVDADSIPGMQLQYDGTVIPICYGLLSDDDQAVPQGVVPAFYMGPTDLSVIGGTGTVDTYMICGHACANIHSVFYNNPDQPDTRLRVPESAFGSIIWAPHKAGWIAKTGQAGQYADYNGLRYTVLFLSQTINYNTTDPDGNPVTVNIADYARNGNVTLTVNLDGIEDVGDGSGNLIDDVDRIWQHFLTNFVFNESSGIGGWNAVPAFGAYSLIDTATVAAAKTIADARISGGYKAGYLIGANNSQRSVFEVIQELLFSGDMNMFVNRHGQLCLSRENTAAASTVTFDAQADLVEDAFQTFVRSDELVNSINYRFAYRYADATAPRASTYRGWATTERAVAPYQKWLSGTQTLADATSIANVQRTIVGEVGEFDLPAIRDALVAADVIAKKLARRVGPTTSRDGARTVEAMTGLQGFEKNSVPVELGSMVSYTHPEGLTSSGWTAKKARVEAVTYDPARYAVTHDARVIP